MTPTTPTDMPRTVTDGPPAGDRGISPVAGRLGGRRGRMISLIALIAGCAVFLAATWNRGEAPERSAPQPDAPPRQLTPFEPARRADPPLLADAADDPEAPRLTDEPIVPALHVETDPGPVGSGPSPSDTRRALAESARRAPLLAYSRSGSDAGRGPVVPDRPTALPEQPTSLDDLRRSGPIETARAGQLPDRDFLIVAGASLPCILQTALDSTTPGYVSCVLPQPVWSESGAVMLLDRGTRVLGEYRGGLQQGRRRLFVLWTRAVTPTGVTIELASPAADALGRAGFDGSVDNRFGERFGGALLLSLVDDAAYAAFAGDESGSPTTRIPSDAAATALRGSIDIPPTLRKAQGSEVTIFVARDLDFRGVYRLRPR